MAKRIIASSIVVSVAAMMGLAGAQSANTISEESARTLLLGAPGTTKLKPGQVRTPILVDGVEFEVVGAAAGEPKIAHLER